MEIETTETTEVGAPPPLRAVRYRQKTGFGHLQEQAKRRRQTENTIVVVSIVVVLGLVKLFYELLSG